MTQGEKELVIESKGELLAVHCDSFQEWAVPTDLGSLEQIRFEVDGRTWRAKIHWHEGRGPQLPITCQRVEWRERVVGDWQEI